MSCPSTLFQNVLPIVPSCKDTIISQHFQFNITQIIVVRFSFRWQKRQAICNEIKEYRYVKKDEKQEKDVTDYSLNLESIISRAIGNKRQIAGG